MWVRSEYAEELAVVCAWFSALIPWSVQFSDLGAIGDLLYVRFPFFQIRYAWGVPLARAIRIDTVVDAYRTQSGVALGDAYLAWVVGAGVLAVAVLLSVSMYAELDVTDRVDTVRLMGALLLGTAVALGAATALLVDLAFPGTPIPVGVVFLAVFGVVLLRVERSG